MRRGQFRNGAASPPARSRLGFYHAPAQTHDLLRLSQIGLHLFVSPKALQRPLCANTIGSGPGCMRCSELMDLLAAPEVVGTAAVAATRQKQAANTRTITSSIFSILKHANDARPSLQRGGGPHDVRLRRAIPRWQVGCSRCSPPAAFDRSSVS
jgi:hypothetical protein